MLIMKNAVAIAGIETVRDKEGHVLKLSVTFLNNMETWARDRKRTHRTKILDCRTFKDEVSPMSSLWECMKTAFGGQGIDHLVISSHSDWEGLYLFSKIRKELGEEDRYITLERDWAGLVFNPGACIELQGCQTGGKDGVRLNGSIAQVIANKTKVCVHGFTCRTSQKRRADGGYIQVPDRGLTSVFIPQAEIYFTPEAKG
jgi:hypothetical protein